MKKFTISIFVYILILIITAALYSQEPIGISIPWIKPKTNIPELPIFIGKVNCQQVRIFFDTGGNGISMSPTMAKKLGVKPISKRAETGYFAGGKTSNLYHAIVDLIEIGNSTFNNVQAIIIPGAEATAFLADITIGVELLRRARILMDYKNKRMIILSQPFLPKIKDSTKLPFKIVAVHNMIIKAKVNEKVLYLHFDTGATFSLDLRRKDAKVYGLTPIKTTEYGQGGAGQSVTTTFFQDTVKLCLGNVCKYVRPISLNEPDSMWDPQCAEFGERISGVVSHNFLTDIQVEYDMEENIIWLLR